MALLVVASRVAHVLFDAFLVPADAHEATWALRCDVLALKQARITIVAHTLQSREGIGIWLPNTNS